MFSKCCLGEVEDSGMDQYERNSRYMYEEQAPYADASGNHGYQNVNEIQKHAYQQHVHMVETSGGSNRNYNQINVTNDFNDDGRINEGNSSIGTNHFAANHENAEQHVLKPIVQERIVEVLKEEFAETIIEVPEIQYINRIVEVPQKIVQEKFVHVIKPIYKERITEVKKSVVEEKVVEVPEYQYVEKVIEIKKPRVIEKIVEVPISLLQEQVVEPITMNCKTSTDVPAPETSFMMTQKQDEMSENVMNSYREVGDMTVEHTRMSHVDVEKIIDVPHVQHSYRNIMTPNYRHIPKPVEVPMTHYRPTPVEKVVDRNVPVPVQLVIKHEYLCPKIEPKYREVPVPVHVQRTIEHPVPKEAMEHPELLPLYYQGPSEQTFDNAAANANCNPGGIFGMCSLGGDGGKNFAGEGQGYPQQRMAVSPDGNQMVPVPLYPGGHMNPNPGGFDSNIGGSEKGSLASQQPSAVA